jgi:2-pyrone-4,6-dicarboxylate lactonase
MNLQSIIPDATQSPRMPTAPTVGLPVNSCDTHCHVFGPYQQFPLRQPSNYPPPDAPVDRYLEMLDSVGMTRGVLVQPAPYGTDATALLDAIAKRKRVLRGVAVADTQASLVDLRRLHEGGVRGLRFVEARDPSGNLFAGSVGFDSVRALAPLMKDAGLHAQVWGPYDSYREKLEPLTELGLDIVIDHMASLSAERGIDDPIFQMVLRLLKQDKVWIKLSVCRVSRQAPRYEDLRPFHDALLEANEDRVLWGSDWPFVRMGDTSPDVGRLIDLAHEWFGDDATREKVWVRNPEGLYGFEAARGE